MANKGFIRIGGQEIPALQSVGALVRFKRQMGYDLAKEPERLDTEGLACLAWCSALSTAKREGLPFDMDFEAFCDGLEAEELRAWYAGENPQEETDAGGDDKKK